MAEQNDKTFTFSFSSGRHPTIRRLMERMDTILLHTVYRPFMRFMPMRVEHVTVPLPGLPAALGSFDLVHLSDFHHSQFVPLAIIEQAVSITNSLRPQVVFLTGDFVTNEVRYAAACARTLGHLQAPLGVYAILGNHDYWTDAAEVAHQLRANGITVLINEARHLVGNLWVVGLDDAWSGKPDWQKMLVGIPEGATTILLAHEPDVADQAGGKDIALQLSGHSHGGQIYLPFTKRRVLPFLAWKYYAGLQRVGDTWVYTNHGLGTMQPPFIFTCRPEVAHLHLEARTV